MLPLFKKVVIMKNIINYIVVGILVVLSSFYIFCTVSFASALPTGPLEISPDDFTVIEGEGGYQSYFEFSASPDMVVYGIDQILNSINNSLYNTFGYDLQDAAWYAEDWLTSDSTLWNNLNSVVNIVSNGNLDVNSAIQQGYYFFNYQLPFIQNALGENAKTWILGKYDDVSGKITDIIGNTMVPVTQELIDNMSSVFSGLEESEELTNLTDTESNIIFGRDVAFTFYMFYNSTIENKGNKYQCIISYEQPVLFFTRDENTDRIPDSIYVVSKDRNFRKLSYTLINTSNGQNVSSSYPGNVYSIQQITGTDLYVGLFRPYQDSVPILYSDTFPSASNFLKLRTNEEIIQTWNALQGAYSYNVSLRDLNNNLISIKNLLNQLLGHYVSTNDLADLMDTLKQMPIKPTYYPNPSPNGDPLPKTELAPTLDQWTILNNKIDSIIETFPAVDPLFETLPSPNPNPNPDPDPDPEPSPSDFPTGIGVPEDFPTDIFEPFTDVLKLPFSFLSVFEPIFYMFNHTLLFPLWLLVPCFIIICFIIWALK